MATDGKHRRLWWKWLGLAALCLMLGIVLFLTVAWHAMRSHDFRYASGAKQLGLILNMYAYDTGAYPLLSSRPGRLMFETASLEPDYLPVEPYIFISPADTAMIEADSKGNDYCFNHGSYHYLGYAVGDDDSVLAFAEAYKKRLLDGGSFDSDLAVDRPYESIKRLVHENHSAAQSHVAGHSEGEFPLLIERPRPYPGMLGLWLFGPVIPLSPSLMGGCVVYLDGHMEFLDYPGKWPMTATTMQALAALESERNRLTDTR